MIVTTHSRRQSERGRGAYKFKGQQSLHFDVIEQILEKVEQAGLPPTPIVMHGSSSVPKTEVERINAAGGKLDLSARGVDEEEYLPAAKLGVTKVTSIQTAALSGLTCIANIFATTRNGSISDRQAKSSCRSTLAHKNEKLGSAGQLETVRASVNE